MFTSRSCSWCHSMNPTAERYCRSCGHEAHVARLDCGCPRCTFARRLAAAAASPVPLAGAIEEALAVLRRVAPQDSPDGPAPTKPERGTTVTAKNDSGRGEPLTAQETTRTPVSARLADLIRALDEALLEEFGPVWFAYVILGRDGLVAASDARHGFVPPLIAPAAPPEPPDPK